MGKSYNLKVNRNDLVILMASIEKLQIFGKDAPAVADIYMRLSDIYAKSEADIAEERIPPQ